MDEATSAVLCCQVQHYALTDARLRVTDAQLTCGILTNSIILT